MVETKRHQQVFQETKVILCATGTYPDELNALGIFSGDFESGTVCGWSTSVGDSDSCPPP